VKANLSVTASEEACGASQVVVAEAAGISQGYLSQLEQDEREPALPIAAGSRKLWASRSTNW
jgi:transcriptional regulator with XRE-family HTH domain